jgi:K+-sensing histidine kinase KdpD
MQKIYLTQAPNTVPSLQPNGSQYGYSSIPSALLSIVNLVMLIVLVIHTILGLYYLIKYHTKVFTVKFISISLVAGVGGLLTQVISQVVFDYIFYSQNTPSFSYYYNDPFLFFGAVIPYSIASVIAILISVILNKKYNQKYARRGVYAAAAFCSIIPLIMVYTFMRNY